MEIANTPIVSTPGVGVIGHKLILIRGTGLQIDFFRKVILDDSTELVEVLIEDPDSRCSLSR